MSYSKVCKFSFQIYKISNPYHIAGSDLHMWVIVAFHQHNLSYTDSFYESKNISVDNIVNKHMFVTAFGQSLATSYRKGIRKIECLEQML